jgi:hypothetical protein
METVSTIQDRDYDIVYVRHGMRGTADYDPCSIKACPHLARFYFRPPLYQTSVAQEHCLCAEHTLEWCLVHQVNPTAIPTITADAWVAHRVAGDCSQVPWFRYTATGTNAP